MIVRWTADTLWPAKFLDMIRQIFYAPAPMKGLSIFGIVSVGIQIIGLAGQFAADHCIAPCVIPVLWFARHMHTPLSKHFLKVNITNLFRQYRDFTNTMALNIIRLYNTKGKTAI